MSEREAKMGASESYGGVFVVLEGIDGAGTTTQAARLASHLRARRRLAHVTREPSGGPVGSLIRLVLSGRTTLPATRQAEVMALLFAADRLDHVESEVGPLLRDGYVVISDRYDLSSLAYQTTSALEPGADPRLMAEWIRACNRHALRPDVTVVLDVSPELAAARRRERGGARELFEDPELQVRLASAYRRADVLVPGDRIVHVDGDPDVDTVTSSLLAALSPFLK